MEGGTLLNHETEQRAHLLLHSYYHRNVIITYLYAQDVAKAVIGVVTGLKAIEETVLITSRLFYSKIEIKISEKKKKNEKEN